MRTGCLAKGRRLGSAGAVGIVRGGPPTAKEEVERLLRERQAVAGQGCRGPPAPYHSWRDDGDGTDGDDIAVGQGGRV